MTWAERRRFMIIGTAAAIAVVLVAALLFSVLYDAPSCMDRKQNQGEEGTDCGGPCSHLCSALVDAPRVSFARAFSTTSGRTDVISYVENRNQEAEAKNARYTVELFSEAGLQLAKREGMIDLPARSVVPVFVPGMYMGPIPVARAFVTFNESITWTPAKEGRTLLKVADALFTQGAEPRVTATLENPSATAFYNVRVVVIAFDAEGSALAASQTVVREVPAQGSAPAVFTWTAPFGDPIRIEVLPVLPLP